MNLKGDFTNFKVWTRAQADIDRITEIWRDYQSLYGGPFLLGERSMADAMYAPVVTRFLTYHVKLDAICGAAVFRARLREGGLRNFGMTIGIRDTRKIIGRTNLTELDVRGEARFVDAIGIFPEFIDGRLQGRGSQG